ncbi:hypothetical protein, partial [Pseudomonas sp. PB101]|uniref:hypothetical protein n=1 Tax=Pseudomonas sp. PB101 TaxID=2495428 RepID=UPI0013663071
MLAKNATTPLGIWFDALSFTTIVGTPPGASSLLQSGLHPKSWTPILTFGGVSMGKFSLQFKITAIEAYINGNVGFRK